MLIVSSISCLNLQLILLCGATANQEAMENVLRWFQGCDVSLQPKGMSRIFFEGLISYSFGLFKTRKRRLRGRKLTCHILVWVRMSSGGGKNLDYLQFILSHKSI
jgi:hypothetical protein